ncbi:MAG: HD domain-containing protein [Clostridia bacterium]|nr:HD domain-containing protein [Clostridia bacterium]
MTGQEFLQILHVAERLKDTPRHCTTSKGRIESVAEHSWRISLMAMLLKHEFPNADIDKVVRMCLIHDIGECFTGDIPTFRKSDLDRDIEHTLLMQWVSSLPQEIADDLSVLYAEMNAQETLEAKLYKSMDKLEAVIQHNESPLDTWEAHEYSLNQTYAFDTVAFSGWLTQLRQDILQETLSKIDQGSNNSFICT